MAVVCSYITECTDILSHMIGHKIADLGNSWQRDMHVAAVFWHSVLGKKVCKKTVNTSY